MVSGSKTPKYMSFSWLDTYLVEDNLQEQISKIVLEEIQKNIRLRRRLDMLDYEVESRLGRIYRPDNICRYVDGDELLDVISEAAIDSMYYNYFANIDDGSGEWAEIYYDMVGYIKNKYGGKIKKKQDFNNKIKHKSIKIIL